MKWVREPMRIDPAKVQMISVGTTPPEEVVKLYTFHNVTKWNSTTQYLFKSDGVHYYSITNPTVFVVRMTVYYNTKRYKIKRVGKV